MSFGVIKEKQIASFKQIASRNFMIDYRDPQGFEWAISPIIT